LKRLAVILPLLAVAARAQCVMCFRTAAAQQMERARILNFGILIILIPPILILGGFLFLAWRRNAVYAQHDKLACSETLYPLAAGVSHAGDGSTGE